jgi:hypothetical protein
MSKNLFDTCVFWSCVTRCGCRTTSSTLFTVWESPNSDEGTYTVHSVQYSLYIRTLWFWVCQKGLADDLWSGGFFIT